MKALHRMSNEKYDMKLVQNSVPEIENDEVLIKVKYAGICGTDIKMYQGKYITENFPIALGHEFSGVIVSKGKDVTDFNINQEVTVQPAFSFCGKCHNCLDGRTNICSSKNRMGFEKDGAFANYVKVKQRNVLLLPENIDPKMGAMVEPMAVVIHGLKDLVIKPTDVVCIIGPGTIGQLALQIAKSYGASVFIGGLSKDKKKLDIAKENGASLTLEMDKEDVEKIIMEQTKGKGTDIVLECTGSASGVNDGLKIVKSGGHYVQLGTNSEEMKVDFMKIAYKEIDVTGSYSHTKADWINAVQLLDEGKVDVEALIQDIYPLEEWQEAFDAAEQNELIKIMLKL